MRRNLNAILPIGTRIVLKDELRDPNGGLIYPKGAVGTIIYSPADHQHAYRLRFLDGHEDSFKRNQFSLFGDYQDEGMEAHSTSVYNEADLFEHVIFGCVVGSRAYGLDESTSDYDRRGIYLPPADLHWSLYGLPEQLERKSTEDHYWELQKFLNLALKANPNILECLYTPLVEYADPLAEELLAMRSSFLSKLIYQTYNGYVTSQFHKLQNDIRLYGEIRWKHAMHLIRLQLAGITILREGRVLVEVGEHRERLLEVRRAALPWEEVNAWRLELHQEFNMAFMESTLPDRPDYDRANAFLIQARRARV
jgi:hypothetical protein